MGFQRIILVHYHEIGLKGHNRASFETRLQRNLEALLAAHPLVTIHRIAGRLVAFLREGPSYEQAVACADAIVGVRYASAAIMQGAAEAIAYGTAVKFI